METPNTTEAAKGASPSSAQGPKLQNPVASAATQAAHEKAGAHSVAEAVKKAVDIIVAEVGKAQPQDQDLDFRFSGSRGGRFVAEGPVGTFGASGTIKLGGTQLQTLEWSSQRVVGYLPADAPTGEVTVDVGEKKTVRGRFRG